MSFLFSAHHSDQLSEMSQVSKVILCVEILKLQSAMTTKVRYNAARAAKNYHHDRTLWASVMKAVPKLDESESGQMVSEKVKFTILMYIYHKQCEIMKGLKQPTLLFLQLEVTDWQEPFAKNAKWKLKGELLKISNWYDLSRVGPCERARPEDSKNVVVFEIWRF